jgi:hypothetical protein
MESQTKLQCAIEAAKADFASDRLFKPKVLYVLWDAKNGEYILRQIKANGKPIRAAVYPDGRVEYPERSIQQ